MLKQTKTRDIPQMVLTEKALSHKALTSSTWCVRKDRGTSRWPRLTLQTSSQHSGCEPYFSFKNIDYILFWIKGGSKDVTLLMPNSKIRVKNQRDSGCCSVGHLLSQPMPGPGCSHQYQRQRSKTENQSCTHWRECLIENFLP